MLPWCDGRPTWRDLEPWSAMMRRHVTPWELRLLKRISTAFFAATEASAKAGAG